MTEEVKVEAVKQKCLLITRKVTKKLFYLCFALETHYHFACSPGGFPVGR
jgi:hypothetical protein